MNRFRRPHLILSLLFLFLPVNAGADWLQREAAIMGTAINVELWAVDEAKGRELIDAVLQEMHRIDALMSTWKPDSLLSEVNRKAASEPVVVGPELYNLIAQALRYSTITHGAFDITYASVGYLYDYRSGVHPDASSIAAALPSINYRFVVLDPATSSVHFLHQGVRIDLGGIAKGYAVDRAIGILQAAGIHNALVSAGGDTRVIGRRDDHPWNVGIRDPRNRSGLVSVIPLEDTAISTSGDYERYFEENGIRYHHILDPGTGDSARALHSASVIAASATDTDALSTSVFVLGVEKGLALINSLPDTEAILIDNNGKLHFSSGLARISADPAH